MNYGSEIELPAQQIRSAVLSAVPNPNYQGSIQSLVPFEQQREQTISHLTKEYDAHTRDMVQTKEQTDLVNESSRKLKNIQGKNTSIKTKIHEEQKHLDEAKKELQIQMSKQKIVFDLFLVFGATIVVYLLFRSFAFVHMIALVVLVVGILYVFQYNAYRIRIFGFDDIPKVHHVPGTLDPENKWWLTSFVSNVTPGYHNSK
jgi:vacuolar-type H+-ATPase subunit I/STV1